MNAWSLRKTLRPFTRPLCVGLLLTAPALLLGGCQALSERFCRVTECEQPSPSDDRSPGERLLMEELTWLGSTSVNQRENRYDSLRDYLNPPACSRETVVMAMTYNTLEEAPESDREPLAAAMQQCINAATPPVPRGMVRVLHAGLATERNTADQRITELEAAVQRERDRNAALEQQLEDLKAIERSLRERGAAGNNDSGED